MKRSEMGKKLSEKLQKSKNLFDGYANENLDLRCLCDSLQERILNFIEDEGMLPPTRLVTFDIDNEGKRNRGHINQWEPEDED